MSIEIKGIEKITEKLQTLEKVLSPRGMESSLNTIGDKIRGSIEESFEEERSPFGQPWAPLKIATLREKKKLGYEGKKLRREGALADQWIVQTDANSVMVSNNATSRGGYHYGKVQNWGSKKSAGRGSGVRARPFLPVDEGGALEPVLLRDIVEHLDEKIKKEMK